MTEHHLVSEEQTFNDQTWSSLASHVRDTWARTEPVHAPGVDVFRVADDVAVLGLQLAAGSWRQTPGTRGSAALLLDLLQRDLTAQLERRMTNRRWAVDGHVGRAHLAVWVHCETPYLPHVLETVREWWAQWPDLRASFAPARQAKVARLAQLEKDPQFQGYAALAQAVHGPGHPLGVPRDGTAVELAKCTPPHVETLWSHARMGEAPHLTIASRFQPQEFLDQMGTGLHPPSWAAGLREGLPSAGEAYPIDHEVNDETGRTPQGQARVFLGRSVDTDPSDARALSLLTQATYGTYDAAANDVLRGQLGVSYSVSGAVEVSRTAPDAPSIGDVGVSWACALADRDRASAALNSYLDSLDSAALDRLWERGGMALLMEWSSNASSAATVVRARQALRERGGANDIATEIDQVLSVFDAGPRHEQLAHLRPESMHRITVRSAL